MSDRFVNAYVVETGNKQRIPRHWLTHPTIGPKFRLTPKAQAAERTADGPLGGLVTRPNTPTTGVISTTPASTTPPSTNQPSSTETPAAGAKE